MQSNSSLEGVPILVFATPEDWANWLEAQHETSRGAWLRLAKKRCPSRIISHAEALENALCYGWIDGQKRPESKTTWLEKYVPRGRKSIWSKINREKALALIESMRM